MGGKTYSVHDLAACVGVSPATLRAWERRYGLLSAHRTQGGHRVYTEADLKLFLYINHLRESGMSLIAIGKMERDVLERGAKSHFESLALPNAESHYETIVARSILNALVARKFDDAIDLLERCAITATAPTEFANLALGIMRAVGNAWTQGLISISIEHLFTARVRFLLAEQFYRSRNALHGSITTKRATKETPSGPQLSPSPRIPNAANSRNPVPLAHAVLAGVSGEVHEIGLLRVAIFLQHWGLRVTYLGPDLPQQDLADFLSELSKHRTPGNPPLIVCLGISAAHSESETHALARELNHGIAAHYPTALGGGGIAKLTSIKGELRNLLLTENLDSLWSLIPHKGPKGR